MGYTQQQQADERKRAQQGLEFDKEKTEQVFARCEQKLVGYKLPTGNVVMIMRSEPSNRSGAQPDGVKYATMTINHFDAGPIPVAQARFRKGQYELLHGASKETFADMDSLMYRLDQVLGEFTNTAIQDELAYFRSTHPGHSRRFP